MTDPETYNFIALCPVCKQARGVAASKQQILENFEVAVYAIQCDHTWKLNQEDSEKLRKHSQAVWTE